MKKLAWAAAAFLCCAFVASPAAAQHATSTQRQRQERNRIRVDEIQASNANSVYQLIQSRRGMWLMRDNQPTSLGENGGGQLLVFFDGAQLGGVEELREVPLAGVQVVEFLNPAETEHKLGKYTTIGAIRVLSHDDAQADSAHAAHPR